MRIDIAIIGAAGFLGRALVDLSQTEGLRVTGFTRASPHVQDSGAAHDGLASARTAYWLATSINPKIAEESPDLVAADHAAFGRFLDLVGSLEAPPRVVLLSSGGTVYDDGHPPYDENTATTPVSAYGRAKLALEGLIHERGPEGSVVLRVANAYGPGQPVASGQGVVAHWLRAARRGEHLHMFGDPDTERDYVYVRDVAEAMLAVHHCSTALPPVINIGSGVPTSLQTLADAILTVVDHPDLRIDVERARSFDVHRTWLDVTRARTALGWVPRTSLGQGLTAAWAAVSVLGDPAP